MQLNMLKKTKMNEYRKQQICKIIPKNVGLVLDIGSRGELFKDYKTTTVDVVEKADIKQDLNLKQTLPLKENSFDLVVANQILEHLCYLEKICEEIKRVSKRYVLIGLPNELTYSSRIKMLFGRQLRKTYDPYTHKHFFTMPSIEKFIKKYFGKYVKKEYWFACSGAKFLPIPVRKILAKIYPNLFAGEVYYLIDLYKNETKNKKTSKRS